MIGMLRSPALLGYAAYRAEGKIHVVHHPDTGEAVRRGPEILDPTTWRRLAHALAQRSKDWPTTRRTSPSLLLGITRCGAPDCGQKMHAGTSGPTGDTRRIYRCSTITAHVGRRHKPTVAIAATTSRTSCRRSTSTCSATPST